MRLVKYRGHWCAAWSTDRGTKRVSLRLPDTACRADAERAFADFQQGLKRPASTVGEIVVDYLADKAHTATDAGRLHDAWKALAPSFAHLRPDQLDRAACRLYVAKRRAAGRGDGTIRKELGTLRAALRWHNPQTPAVFELPSAPPPRDRYLTRPEVERLIAAADAPHVALAIRLMWATAGRKEAILSLRWDQVDFDRGLIQLARHDGKSRKGRATVPMTEKARAALLEARAAAQTDWVVEWAGKPVASIRTGFAAAARRAGLADVSPHVLRHSAAVAMAEAGATMPQIAAVLGHSDSRITERVYARFSPGFLRGPMAALE